ncbi:hypothetical protein M433DRAFT_156381 [Acidomyces richmondensis BFW]|nr:MAG: hypothetical protein FE78DRAFT_93253 [Acidomyces sp. 'richmondensis']KYG43723.1 hypothetical protein M433DRAFT_156381 [Acidomyces richmondensis BFW]
MQHAIYQYALDGRLFIAPISIDKLHHILDVGTGTGIWVMDVADENSQAQVVSFDLSPIQPDTVPSKFLLDDCNSDWLFAEKFGLIHTRAMTPGIKDWSRYLQRAYDNLNPGACIELHEIPVPARCTEATSSPVPYFVEWSRLILEASSKVGLDVGVAEKLKELYRLLVL